jgi:7-carboxy-7-deazaguanine synthase
MSISPKLASSGPDPEKHSHWSHRHERQRLQPEVIRELLSQFDYQLKFVIDRPRDVGEVAEFLAHFPEVRSDCVLLMPQGITQETLTRRTAWLAPMCSEKGWTLCPRRQIEWFGPVRGT